MTTDNRNHLARRQGRGPHRGTPSSGLSLSALSFRRRNTAGAGLCLLIGVLLSIAGPALGANWKLDASWIDYNNCHTGSGDVAIAGCTAVINDASESAIR